VSCLGVLMLETRFPRLPGDIGHRASVPGAVLYRTVAGASPRRVVQAQDASLLAPFIAAGEALVRDGATALTTSCGFLVCFQRELQAALPVPVWTSSLLKLPELVAPGVITVDAASLGTAHLLAAGARADVPVEGLARGCHLQRTLLEDRIELDARIAEADTVAAACRLVERCPGIDALVLECTNLPPYATAVARATGRPVHHLLGFLGERLGWPGTSPLESTGQNGA
jgi:hypothetical protein